ncbi:hypothetical protein GUITHDRAFT_146591 [Guillardia theta CCMP2712]|uniref:Uncharacterized protein n=1 Tax=Guillardia theta (strain CCMP2712) TaxID=905079 RepID=L1IGE6_GUITC|nr:hypothetical protein GUITHDRAFT_146591 [Guillardia theta CCMP2712]EKX35283.1 hypothetical protein GUITHDRAFT_146591 [Guillardia theta CCMP2712]|eukprot:XP_005822263.1 hypothetical protein GUITHDRAFT_146591 [Guillardia theta CCMP2712]
MARQQFFFPRTFSVCTIFEMLHLQPYEPHLKQRVSTGMLDRLVIPDTIAFRKGFPGYPRWYLTSVVDMGMIKRKNSFNVTPRKILEAFTIKKSRQLGRGSSGIIAMLIEDVQSSSSMAGEEEFGKVVVEYLDEVMLRDFLQHRAGTFSGILQKWVEPKGPANSMLHAAWHNNVCKVDSVTNVRSLRDRRCSMYERAVTFDGGSSLTRRDPVPLLLQKELQGLCSSISRHVGVVTEQKVSVWGIQGYFKVRGDGKVVFLWASNLKISSSPSSSSTSSSADASFGNRICSPTMSAPGEVNSAMSTIRSRTYVCPVSNKVCRWEEAKTFISYKMIILEWNSRFPPDSLSLDFRPSSARVLEGRRALEPPPPPPPPRPLSARISNHRPLSARVLVDGRATEGKGATGDELRTLTEGGEERLSEQKCIPELIRKLENLSDVSLYKARLRDASFLYKQVRVSDEVAKYFASFAPSVASPRGSKKSFGLGHFLDHEQEPRPASSPVFSSRTQSTESTSLFRSSSLLSGQGKENERVMAGTELQHKTTFIPPLKIPRLDRASSSLPLDPVRVADRLLSHRQQAALALHLQRFRGSREQPPTEEKESRRKREGGGWRRSHQDFFMLESLKARVPERVNDIRSGGWSERKEKEERSEVLVPTAPKELKKGVGGLASVRRVGVEKGRNEEDLYAMLVHHEEQELHEKEKLKQLIAEARRDLQLIEESQSMEDSMESVVIGPMEDKTDEEHQDNEEDEERDEGDDDDDDDDDREGEEGQGGHRREEGALDPDDFASSSDAEVLSGASLRSLSSGQVDTEAFTRELEERRAAGMERGSDVPPLDEFVLSALESVTNLPAHLHRELINDLLPELDPSEQRYFFDILADCQGFEEDLGV